MQATACETTGHEIAWDGRTVWVNSCKDSMCIGRFTKVSAEVHRDTEGQLTKGECLDCFEDTSPAGWERFKASMLEHYNVTIPDNIKPEYLR